MARIVRLYKPGKDGKEFYREWIFHKLEVLKAITESWEQQYGPEFIELVAIS